MDLLGIFLLGLVGSAHCVGMCGGFVLALAQLRTGGWKLQAHQLLYFTGKAITYALLGALAGGVGHALGAAFTGAQDVLSIALGVLLVGIGLGLLGVLRRFEGPRFLSRLLGRFSMRLGRLLRRPRYRATFGLGLVNGLLPCGLVYGALALAAATESPARGALAMAVFGLATIPALYALALAGTLMRPAWRARLNQVGGVVVILLGLLTILRGTPALAALMGHGGGHSQHEMVAPDDGAQHGM